jgi:hypothetical protein
MAYWLDEGWHDWPEIDAAGTAAAGLYARCGSYIADVQTDGFIPTARARMYGTPEWIQRLVEVGLWAVEEHGFRDTRYFPLNKPKAEIELAKARRAEVRDPLTIKAVRARDGDWCRYCGIKVNWSDRRGLRGGTYDHVIPGLVGGVDNLVVACRSCNSSKKNRTPEQAGMTLRPPPPKRTPRSGSKSDSDPYKKITNDPSPSSPNGEGFPPNAAGRHTPDVDPMSRHCRICHFPEANERHIRAVNGRAS